MGRESSIIDDLDLFTFTLCGDETPYLITSTPVTDALLRSRVGAAGGPVCHMIWQDRSWWAFADHDAAQAAVSGLLPWSAGLLPLRGVSERIRWMRENLSGHGPMGLHIALWELAARNSGLGSDFMLVRFSTQEAMVHYRMVWD